jgi:UDP-N-acetylglucosamine 2-epimerase (non-hydrolysing)
MVFGDVNSTVAAALCAAKMGIEVAHVEAGLRSFDRTMPEELNRIITDHLSDYLFTTEPSGRDNLIKEGIRPEKIFFVGNVMVDTLLKHRARASRLDFKSKLGLSNPYAVLTMHRPSNVDSSETLIQILRAVDRLAQDMPIVFPCHPRTRQCLAKAAPASFLESRGQQDGKKRVTVLEPLGYLEFLSLMLEASLVLTDSGGIQEETTALGIPCLTLRENTERPITVSSGTNILTGTRTDRILAGARKVMLDGITDSRVPDLWDGRASERIAEILNERLSPDLTRKNAILH